MRTLKESLRTDVYGPPTREAISSVILAFIARAQSNPRFLCHPRPRHAPDPSSRTQNPKKTSHMPLAGLCASRGRRDCPDLLRAPADDRCFALVQADSLVGEKAEGRPEKHKHEGNATDGGGNSPAPGRRKWGIGGTLPANLVHGRRWRGGAGAENGAATTGMLTRSSSPGRAAVAAGRPPRERMGFETSTAKECTALVDEINELVRRTRLKHTGSSFSSRGRDLFDEWVRSVEVRREADADAEAAERSAEATRSTPADVPTEVDVV